jgi:hypothetical protein
MSLKDYSDEDDYYTQGFEKEGVVSIWVGLEDSADDPEELDVLQDLCGVGYYELDNQEANCFDFKSVTLQELFDELSYSDSFINEAIEAARSKEVLEARWVIVQYDFEYDPCRVTRPIADDPVFLGCFSYVVE